MISISTAADNNQEEKQNQLCCYCWNSKATVCIEVAYDYDYSSHKDKISNIPCCDICHLKLDPKKEFPFTNISSDFIAQPD